MEVAIVAATRQPRMRRRIGVDDEGIGKPGPGRHIGQIGHPQPVRGRRGEPSLDEVGRPRCCWIGDGGAFDLAASRAGQRVQPLHTHAGPREGLQQTRPHAKLRLAEELGNCTKKWCRWSTLKHLD